MSAVYAWAEEAAPASPIDDAKFSQLLSEGSQRMMANKPLEAIAYADKIIAAYEDAYRGEKAKFFSARSQPESLMYLAEAANAKKAARVVSANWAYAYHLKAYALIDLGRIPQAKDALERAVALSPHNSLFLAGLGNLYQLEKDWPKSLQAFKLAEEAIQVSTPNLKNADLARAWRGMAFALVQQNQLDEAERLYRKCLELDKNDARAAGELRYVLSLKAKAGGVSSPSAAADPDKMRDPLYLNDAVHATFVAASACKKPDDAPVDATKPIQFFMAAEQELERRGMSQKEAGREMILRMAKIKEKVNLIIKADGCDSDQVRQLVANFKKLAASGK